MDEPIIVGIWAREILDSRGNPTVEAEVELESGDTGWAAVPSGASTGSKEALELRDGDGGRYSGKGALTAVKNIMEKIAPEILGLDATDQLGIDRLMIDLDGTPNKTILGANAILAVSMAVARAASSFSGLPLYQYLGGVNSKVLPFPMFNVINGGKHADNNVDIQEFMIVPAGLGSFSESLRAGSEIFQALKKLLKAEGMATSVGDEGGMAPNFKSNREVLEFLKRAIGEAGYECGKEIFFALDCAANEFFNEDNGKYKLSDIGEVENGGLADYYGELIGDFDIVSIEDPFHEGDWTGWMEFSRNYGDSIQIVGDDLLVTNPKYIREGIERKAANASLIKLNQIGTLSETLDAVRMSFEASWGVVISHRSGETEDTFIADLAVATGSGQIKTGSVCRGERIAKYNRLIRIEEDLAGVGIYPNPAEIYKALRK